MCRAAFFLMLVYASVSEASAEWIETSPCPGFVSSYDAATFETVLVVTDRNFASIEDCQRLGKFFFESPSREYLSLDFSRVAAIVDETWEPAGDETAFVLIDAILSWLKGTGLEQHAEAIKDFIDDHLPEGAGLQLFFTIVLWLIIAGVVVLVLNEFYRAGLLQWPRIRRTAAQQREHDAEPGSSWQTMTALPLRQQAGALLQFSIDQLVRRGLIPSASSLTNHELLAHLERSDARKAGLLRHQIAQTEPVIYGDAAVSEECIQLCRSLAEGLNDA